MERHDVRAFNDYAATFDETVGDSPVVRELRQRVYREIHRLVAVGGRILDINCGTGTDCVALAEAGYKVLGVDLSPEMIAHAQRKVRPGLDVRFEVLPFDRLQNLESGTFSLVLSNNSGLNCAHDLRAVLTDIHALLCAGGACVMVVMPPFSLWECLAGLARFDMRYSLRRGKKGVANICGTPVEVRYYGEKDVQREAAGMLKIEHVLGFNIVAPSPNSHMFVKRLPALSRWLCTIDRWISHVPIIRRWGDQILMVLRKI